MEAEKQIQELHKGILNWYPFAKEEKILVVVSETDTICSLFSNVDSCTVFDFELNLFQDNTYDYIIADGVLERVLDITSFFEKSMCLLKEQGKLLFSMDNRLGLRYFCGDRDNFTNRNFDSIEKYRRVSNMDLQKQSGRALDRAFVESCLKEAGFKQWQRYSVLPNVDTPQLIYAQDYLPEEDLSMRYIPMFHSPDTVFLEEQYLYDSLIQNDMFHQLANGYLFECTVDGELSNIKHVTLSMDRGEEAAMATMIDGRHKVYKKALYSQGVRGLEQIQKNHEDLKLHGISTIEGVLKNNIYEMPYVEAELANTYLQDLLRQDKDAFIHEIDKLREMILQSSEHVQPCLTDYEEQEIIKDAPIQNGVWLARGYFDLVPLNAFYIDGEYVFFDQEFCIENYPANLILVRTIDIVYGGHSDLEAILPRTYFWQRYDMENQVTYLKRKSVEFLHELRHQKELRNYNEKHLINYGAIHSNRQRMNFSADEYQRLFINIFEGLDCKKAFVFGSGNFAKKFLDLYGGRYQIEAVLDNNEEKWGTCVNGVTICSPSILDTIDKDECKVIICIKNYLGVLQQLKEAGIKHIGIYDTNMMYPAVNRVRTATEVTNGQNVVSKELVKKKYHTGYIAGVFDLYHIGHLNMFRRAKEQCEYLIVGVVSDEGVRKNKRTMPFIPFEERIEMVRSCKYVDEAVEIPFQYAGTRDAYRLYHFDVQFSGSDYENDPNWLAEREFLRKQGADMVFFPYTEQTSSSKIKALINKQLEDEAKQC